jgi:hypothetical protein
VIIGFGVVAGMTIFAYAFYIIFFPLLKTISPFKIIQGNLPMLKERDEQRVKTLINKGYSSLFDVRRGFCGDSVAEKVSVDER